MDHNYAINNHVAEGYLLGDLNEQERDAYEEHYFSCAVCAEEVKAASEFIVNAKKFIHAEKEAELYREAKRHAIWGNWLNWRSIMQPLPATACMLVVVLGGFSGYQNRVTIPELRQMTAPQLIARQPVLRHSKGDAVYTVVARPGKQFSLPFEIPKTQYTSYTVSVLTDSNLRKLSLGTISAAEAEKALEMLVPSGNFNAGRYFLLIEGFDAHSKGEVDRIPFDIKFQD
jgi:hypothetical protein